MTERADPQELELTEELTEAYGMNISDKLDLLRPASFDQAVAGVFDIALRLMMEKRRARGTENIEEQGIYGVAMRLASDKMARVKHVTKKVQFAEWCEERIGEVPPSVRVSDEEMAELEDDLVDIANYAAILLALLRGWW